MDQVDERNAAAAMEIAAHAAATRRRAEEEDTAPITVGEQLEHRRPLCIECATRHNLLTAFVDRTASEPCALCSAETARRGYFISGGWLPWPRDLP